MEHHDDDHDADGGDDEEEVAAVIASWLDLVAVSSTASHAADDLVHRGAFRVLVSGFQR
jgi:hypothetical protein